MISSSIFVVVFESTHFALGAEKILQEKGYSYDIIPTPREITASCGLSIRFDQHLLEEMKNLVSLKEISIKGIFQLLKLDGEKKVQRIL